jgi:putative hydrolase of the HAD superfamily
VKPDAVVLFDLDETLLDHRWAERRAALEFHARFPSELGPDPQAFAARWHALAERWFERYGRGLTTFQGQRRGRMRELFGAALDDRTADERFEQYILHYERHWAVFPDVADCLDALAGLPLGVITNGVAEQQNKKLAKAGLARRFSQVLCSADLGVAKPDPRIFLLAAERFGAAPDRCWYVGDRLDTDAQAAIHAGLHGVWLNRSDDPAETDVPTLTGLAGLPGLVLG